MTLFSLVLLVSCPYLHCPLYQVIPHKQCCRFPTSHNKIKSSGNGTSEGHHQVLLVLVQKLDWWNGSWEWRGVRHVIYHVTFIWVVEALEHQKCLLLEGLCIKRMVDKPTSLQIILTLSNTGPKQRGNLEVWNKMCESVSPLVNLDQPLGGL
jgi:hypothetical protein